eukprot:TRINITY_DN61819_c0_g1_i1.p1 TRINITY_DN61819_c0_g1~~TRINITY_DN61819_c0_g1_i1.p1  ORF type:complete len:318 (+),score=48.28 TRINITY_DN61819_c0_g1_i1:71-1024(+)
MPFFLKSAVGVRSVSEMLCHQLLEDEETKDVFIEMSDGVLKVHSLVLRASSDAIGPMLKHGKGATHKTLSWREHSTRVGRFFIGLLYTGSVGEEFVQRGCDQKCDMGLGQLSLDLLLGSLQIASVYMFDHQLHIVMEAVLKRLAVDNFDAIASAAIRLDLTKLRLQCLQYAEAQETLEKQLKRFKITNCGEPRLVGTWTQFENCGMPRYHKEGDRSCTLEYDWDTRKWFIYLADQDKRPTLYHSKGNIKYWEIVQAELWEVVHGKKPAPTFAITGGEPPAMSSLRRAFDEGTFSPDVMIELTPLWGRQAEKKRRLFL